MRTRAQRKQQRLILILVSGAIFALAVSLILFALKDQIVYFRTPTEVFMGIVDQGVKVRIGGLVETGSIVRTDDTVVFGVTDEVHRFTASYTGILPDLFREGQGVVIEGVLGADGHFTADTILAKHDENYVPKEVADALKEQGVWKGDSGS